MDKKRTVILSVLCALTLILTCAAVFFGARLHADSLAASAVAKDVSDAEKANDALQVRRDILKNNVSSKEDDTARKDELNKQITKLTGDISQAETTLADAEKSRADLLARAEDIKKKLSALRDGMDLDEGESTDVGAAGLVCPGTVKAGRYIASGDGVITIIADNGAARVSEDLAVIDTSTYTFDLSEGERVEAIGSVTLTELK